MKIDFHTHCDSTDPKHLREFVDLCEQLETRACIFSTGPRSDHSYVPNEAVMAAAKQFPNTLIPFAFVDLWDHVDCRCIKAYAQAGFKGLKCTSPFYPYDHDLYMDVYEQAQKLNLPIVFHTGAYRPNKTSAINRRPVLTNMQPLMIDRIARSFQDLKIVIAHMGTRIFRNDAAEMIKMHTNVYADLAGFASFASISPSELAKLLAQPTVEIDDSFEHFKKLIFGSDGYMSNTRQLTEAQKWYPSLLERVGAPQAIQNAIMGHTAASWLDV